MKDDDDDDQPQEMIICVKGEERVSHPVGSPVSASIWSASSDENLKLPGDNGVTE